MGKVWVEEGMGAEQGGLQGEEKEGKEEGKKGEGGQPGTPASPLDQALAPPDAQVPECRVDAMSGAEAASGGSR